MRSSESFEKRSLLDSEFMLFVYDDEFEILEKDILLDNCVGSDQYVNVASQKIFFYFYFLLLG